MFASWDIQMPALVAQYLDFKYPFTLSTYPVDSEFSITVVDTLGMLHSWYIMARELSFFFEECHHQIIGQLPDEPC